MVSSILIVAAEAEAASNPILPTLPELFWGALTFLSLWAMVKFVLLPPVLKVMSERDARIRSDLDAAAMARSRAGSAATEVSDQLIDVRTEAAHTVDVARTEAEAERAKVIASAEADVAKMTAAAESEIAAARSEALTGIGAQVAELSASAASRVMDRQIPIAVASPIVDRYLNSQN